MEIPIYLSTYTYSDRDYKELTHIIMEAGKSKSAVRDGRVKTQERQWCS